MKDLIRKLFLLPVGLFWCAIRLVSMFLNKKTRQRVLSRSYSFTSYFRTVTDGIFPHYNKMELRARKLIEKYPLLEIGCGAGYFLKTIKKNGKCVGIDTFNDKNVGGGNFMFIKCDGKFMPFKNETFNTVFTEYTFHHIKQIGLTIKESARVLKDGGKMIVIEEEAPKNIFTKYLFDLNSSWWKNNKEWEFLFLNNGFSEFKNMCLRFKYFGFDFGNKYLFEVIK